MNILEVCCGNWQSVCAAVSAGAERIELCTALPLGGLTPPLSLMRKVRKAFPELTVHVLIRLREGGFVYTPDEIEMMVADIALLSREGADGFVVGALTDDGQVDKAALGQLISGVQASAVTFHRAFDHVSDKRAALDTLKGFGIRRVLTSGGAPTASEGIPVLHELVEQAAGDIIIMPGAGVNAGNAAEILRRTGAKELHASCAVRISDSSASVPRLGTDDNGTVLITDTARVRALMAAMGSKETYNNPN